MARFSFDRFGVLLATTALATSPWLLPACTSDASAPPPYTVAACGPATSPCGEGEICQGGACLDACDESADCPAGSICLDGACLAQGAACTSQPDCPQGSCADGRCIQPPPIRPCTTDAECPVGARCSTDGSCVHDPSAPVCTPGAELCNGVDDDCDGLVDEDLTDCVPQPSCTSDGCTCPEDFTFCSASERCVSLVHDPDNCGACGHTCGAGARCIDAICM